MKRYSMGLRHTSEIHDALCERLDLPTAQKHLVLDAVTDAQINGIRLAADVAKDYDRLSYHPYLVSECILGKLNVLKGKPRKNPMAAKIQEALDSLERKLNNLAGTTRFMAMTAVRKATAKDFPEFPPAKARWIAKAANQMVEILGPLTPKQRQEVLAQVDLKK